MSNKQKKDERTRLPTVLIPYPGPCAQKICHDVFVYLRPETNGVEVESTLLRVINKNPQYKERLRLCYLANIPGDFIVARKIIEKHYALQLHFAVHGKEAFTDYMQRQFEEYFNTSFPEAAIIGAFEAMKLLNMNYNELFQVRVPEEDMLTIHGQTIKRYRRFFIVNYDIPAILHKNNNKTDIAVMIFRTGLEYAIIHRVIDEMAQALVREGILHSGKSLSRIFHYSKGPFDQIRDAIGYLYTQNIEHISLKQIAFANYLIHKGVGMNRILRVVKEPLMQFRAEDGSIIERDIYTYTMDDSYPGAYEKFSRIVSQHSLIESSRRAHTS